MDSKDAIITELRRVVAGLEEQIRSQAERIADLELELAKAKKDSSTSSKPPSSDIVKPSAKKKPPGKRGKRKRGGQPGHKRQLRQPLPPERVDERIDYEINEKDVQRWGLTPTDQFETIQHIELPQSPIHVTEHRLRVYLSPDGEAYLPDCPQLRSNGKKHWIWCITAATFSLFHIASSRSREVLEELVGEAYQGHLNFDYFSANCSFAWHFDIKAQYCWAHLIRDIRFLLKHPDKKTRAWAEQLLDRSRRLFTAWHRREEMTDEGFRRSMLTHRDRFLERVRNPPYTREATNLAARFAMVEYSTDRSPQLQTYDLSQDYFRFMFAAEIEPTNNHSEQQIRHCVIDRRITQGTRGETGQRYHERMWTAIATCGKQNRSFFHFLHQSIAANLSNQPAPSLLTN